MDGYPSSAPPPHPIVLGMTDLYKQSEFPCLIHIFFSGDSWGSFGIGGFWGKRHSHRTLSRAASPSTEADSNLCNKDFNLGLVWGINQARPDQLTWLGGGGGIVLVKQPQGEPSLSHSCLKFFLRLSVPLMGLGGKGTTLSTVALLGCWQSLGKRPGMLAASPWALGILP